MTDNQPIQPTIEHRAAQPSTGLTATVTMQTLAETLGPRLSEVFAVLGERAVVPVGPPFWKYDVIDMEHQLQVVVGVPVAAPVGDERLIDATLPEGDYAVAVHNGHPSGIRALTGALLQWADDQGRKWDMVETDAGQHWACRLEEYLTNPAEVPDPNDWQTRLAFKLRD